MFFIFARLIYKSSGCRNFVYFSNDKKKKMLKYCFSWLVTLSIARFGCPHNWLYDWLFGHIIDRRIAWFVQYAIDGLFVWSRNRSSCRLFRQVIYRRIVCLVRTHKWKSNCLAGPTIDRWIAWLGPTVDVELLGWSYKQLYDWLDEPINDYRSAWMIVQTILGLIGWAHNRSSDWLVC